MRTFEFYWDEEDDWGRHSYYDTFHCESWQEAKDRRDRMLQSGYCFNIMFVEIGDEEEGF